jgi:Na+-transporting methylmalonyl-CoA/oxaloacetate decarboxylase gamma subunit
MAQALWITLVGMGLVFVAILLLWGLMALLVRFTAERPAADLPPHVEAAPALAQQDRQALRRRAAAAAVAVALSLQSRLPAGSRPAATNNLSAWQAVHRSAQMQQAVRLPRRRGER